MIGKLGKTVFILVMTPMTVLFVTLAAVLSIVVAGGKSIAEVWQ